MDGVVGWSGADVSVRSGFCGVVIAIAVASAVAVAGCSTGSSGASGSPAAASAVTVRTVLASGAPSMAAGYEMDLAHYTIPPHTKLATHHHPGMQLAYIESGTLTYTVIEGTVTVHAADGSTRQIAPGATDTIRTGEWLTETPEIVHFGENATDQPISILASSLFVQGDPPAIVASPAPSASPSPTK
jgi:quercetin dioxygenase-like cupin family protein